MSAIRFGNALKEIRIHLCQTNKQSKGVRDFLTSNYVNIKTANPNTPILIRECSGVMPVMYARYEKGVERSLALKDMAADSVAKSLQELAK